MAWPSWRLSPSSPRWAISRASTSRGGDGLSWSDAFRAFERNRDSRGGITKAGNAFARRVLIEGASAYRMPARVSRKLHDRLEGLPQIVRDIAWKAQVGSVPAIVGSRRQASPRSS